jgi:hypothetical protein
MLITTHHQQQQQSNHDGYECNNVHNPAYVAHNNNNDDNDDARLLAALGDYDVLCGRHKAAFNNTGNRRFRITVSLSLACFMKASSRKEKNTVIKSILKIVQGNGGRFLEYDKKVQNFVELSTKKAHMKVGHALRDMALANRKEVVVESGSTSTVAATTLQIVSANTSTTTIGLQYKANTGRSIRNEEEEEEEEQPVMDPWNMLDSIPDASDEGSFAGSPVQPPTPVDHDLDMLQWLVGESDGLLHECLDEIPTAEQQQPQQQQQQPYQPPADLQQQILQYDDDETTTTIIDPIPLNNANHNNNGNSTMDEKDSNIEEQLRESFVMDDSLLQWLVGESNELAADRFQMV